MKNAFSVSFAVVAGFALAACSETTDMSGSSMSNSSMSSSSMAAPSMRTGSATDENACLTAVAQQTGNSVVVLSSEFSEANTLVMVGVGPQRAPWRCLVSNGVVAEVMSTVDEGAL